MKKEILTHLAFLLVLIVPVVLIRHYWGLDAGGILLLASFVGGGLLGTVLPDLDHLIYVYFLQPQDLTSQRVNYMVQKRAIWPTLELLASTRSERKNLIFHTAFFQLIFLVLAFLVVSSSGSIFGRGLVLAFMLHLIVDQLLDLLKIGNLDTWFGQWNIVLEKEKYMFYWLANLFVLLIFAFVL